MQKPKADDISVCTLMLPRPEDEITRPRRKRRKEGYSIDLVKDVVGCFPQRPFFIKGRVCFETVNEETKKVLKFYGKTPETARKLEKNDFACFTGAAWYRAQFREVAVRSRPVMLPPIDAKKERTFDPYKRKLAAKCVYKPIPMPKHIEIPRTPDWVLPMPLDFEEISKQYTDFLYQEHDLRKPVEYDCHWGEYFVPRETEHQNVSFSESLLRGETVLVDEYTPLKFDSVPMVENEVIIPRSSKSKRSNSKKTRKEKSNLNRSPVRRTSQSEMEPSRTGKSTPKSSFRLNPASGNSSKPFSSNVFEIIPAGSSTPLPIRGAQPPDEKPNGCILGGEPMDTEFILKEPKIESEDGESVFESLMNDDADSDKKETDGITSETKKPSLRRSVRKSAVTTKSHGASENNDVSETNFVDVAKIDPEPDESVSISKRRSSNGTNLNKSIKGEVLPDEKPNGYSNPESPGGDTISQKSKKSAVKPKGKNNAISRLDSEENSEAISDSLSTDDLRIPKNELEVNHAVQSKNSSLRRSVRKSSGTGKPNGLPESNGTTEANDTPLTMKMDVEPSEGVTAGKRKITSDEDGPLPKKRRSRPVQRYEPPY